MSSGLPVLCMQTFTYSCATEARESEQSSSLCSFTSTSTPRSSCASPQAANEDESNPGSEQPGSGTSPVVPSLMHALPAEDDESPQPLGTSGARIESVRKSSNVDMSAWQGGYPPLVEIMRVVTSILEGLMVCTSCSRFPTRTDSSTVHGDHVSS